MKRCVVGLLFALMMLPWATSQAGEGSIVGEKKKNSKSTTSVQQRAKIVRQKRVVRAAPRHAGFCQDYYCVRAAASPWWPNAPGD
jgi:hypothetical protein